MNREILSGIKSKPVAKWHPYKPEPEWSVGDDVPFDFEDTDALHLERKRVVYLNYKRGAISKTLKNIMMSILRKTNKSNTCK